jgi:hypothetical protein
LYRIADNNDSYQAATEINTPYLRPTKIQK